MRTKTSPWPRKRCFFTDGGSSVARSKHIKTLHAARAQNNAAAVAGANANVRACASQVRELKDRIERYTQQQIACDRAVCSLREGRQMKKTVSTLTDMQRRFRSLNLGTLQEASVRTMSDMTASHEELGDIRAILGQPVDQHISDPEADMRELEAMLLTDAAVVVAEPAPPHQVDARPRIAGAVKLPSTEDYILALASN